MNNTADFFYRSNPNIVKFVGYYYDEEIIEIKGKCIYPKSVGKTYVTAERERLSVIFRMAATE